jgi:phage/plasmid primase-like uncharacterized protein
MITVTDRMVKIKAYICESIRQDFADEIAKHGFAFVINSILAQRQKLEKPATQREVVSNAQRSRWQAVAQSEQAEAEKAAARREAKKARDRRYRAGKRESEKKAA